ncbi:unnamed protein product, partial [Ectocarpus sp. 12 AP-2014]
CCCRRCRRSPCSYPPRHFLLHPRAHPVGCSSRNGRSRRRRRRRRRGSLLSPPDRSRFHEAGSKERPIGLRLCRGPREGELRRAEPRPLLAPPRCCRCHAGHSYPCLCRRFRRHPHPSLETPRRHSFRLRTRTPGTAGD